MLGTSLVGTKKVKIHQSTKVIKCWKMLNCKKLSILHSHVAFHIWNDYYWPWANLFRNSLEISIPCWIYILYQCIYLCCIAFKNAFSLGITNKDCRIWKKWSNLNKWLIILPSQATVTLTCNMADKKCFFLL